MYWRIEGIILTVEVICHCLSSKKSFWKTWLYRFYLHWTWFQLEITEVYKKLLHLLANSDNTKCRPFQVKINCSKLIIDRLQQQCRMTFLIYLFVTSRNVFVCCISAKEIITILRKIVLNFRQVPLKLVLSQFQQNLLKVPVKKLNL